MNSPAKLIFAAFVGLMGLFATVQTSSAAPMAPAATQQQAASNLLHDVVWPCRRGWVQNRWGRCVRVRPRAYYAPRYYYGPRYYRPRAYYAPRYYYGRRYYRPYGHYRRW